MAEEKNDKKTEPLDETRGKCCPTKKWHHHGNPGGAFGFFGFMAFIGVAVYNVQQVSGFWLIVLAILKAMVWPAFLLHKIFTMLSM